ncbi:zinc finger protein 37-like [Phytophthora cinnamomi]|uniref:zinc finger protein 37-like n=1 Tax=Phytophthora cinnamomi TaxID=4785 RepID=UPI003559D81D|nr:zinc finger protein 37-like [Phytophthora cinnamomi]
MASAVRVLLPSQAASPAAARTSKRRRLNDTSAPAIHAVQTPAENAAAPDVEMTSDDDREVDDEEDDSGRRGCTCAECDEIFASAAELVVHSQETRHRPFACRHEGCSKRYSKREHLTRHVDAVHVRGSTQTLEERKPFKCELCEARFTYNHGLTRHTKRSHRNVNRPFECAECLKVFKKKSELQAHSYVHTGVLPFECEDCGERFLKRFLLTRHQRTHAANRDGDTQVFVCDCGEICFDEDELKSHKEVEHGSQEKADENGADSGADVTKQPASSAHVCLVCDQTFSRKQYLRAHLRTHFESLDNRKQYSCPMAGCEKAYTRSSNLMAHYNAVHDERKSKRFACSREGCSARFGYKTVLKHHIESIHDKPKTPKRRERKSAGVLERALGVNQVGEQVARTIVFADDSEAKPTDEEKEPTAQL